MKITLLQDKEVYQGCKKFQKKKGDTIEFFKTLAEKLIDSGVACLPEDFEDSAKQSKKVYFRAYYGGGKHKIVYGNPDTKEGEDYAPHGTVIYFDDKKKANEAAASLNAEQDK